MSPIEIVLAVIALAALGWAVTHHVTLTTLKADVQQLKATAQADVSHAESEAKLTGDHLVQIVQALTKTAPAPSPATTGAPSAPAPAAAPPAAPAA